MILTGFYHHLHKTLIEYKQMKKDTKKVTREFYISWAKLYKKSIIVTCIKKDIIRLQIILITIFGRLLFKNGISKAYI